MKNKILIILILILINTKFIYADVGVGISPSKIVMQLEEGKTHEVSLLVFNSGDNPLEVTLNSEGEIAKFIDIEPESKIIQPEPSPHSLPIKNGETFIVKFNVPRTGEAKRYIGIISAIGSTNKEAQVGGNVGVATQVELITIPTKTTPIFRYLAYLIVIGIVFIIIILLKRKKEISK